jgi:hypothetical protein
MLMSECRRSRRNITAPVRYRDVQELEQQLKLPNTFSNVIHGENLQGENIFRTRNLTKSRGRSIKKSTGRSITKSRSRSIVTNRITDNISVEDIGIIKVNANLKLSEDDNKLNQVSQTVYAKMIEKDIAAAYGVPSPIFNTFPPNQKNDVPNKHNKILDYHVNIKTYAKNELGMADFRNFYDSVTNTHEPIILFLYKYSQRDGIRNFINYTEIDITDTSLIFFGNDHESVIEYYDELKKWSTTQQKILTNEQKQYIYSNKTRIQKMINYGGGIIKLSPKIHTNGTYRFQATCNINSLITKLRDSDHEWKIVTNASTRNGVNNYDLMTSVACQGKTVKNRTV